MGFFFLDQTSNMLKKKPNKLIKIKVGQHLLNFWRGFTMVYYLHQNIFSITKNIMVENNKISFSRGILNF